MSTIPLRRKKLRKKASKDVSVSNISDIDIKETKREKSDSCVVATRKRSSSLAASANHFAYKHLSGKRGSVPFLYRKKDGIDDQSKRITSAQVQLVNNALKHIVSSKNGNLFYFLIFFILYNKIF